MSVAQKMGLAYAAYHRDPYCSRRNAILNDPKMNGKLWRHTSSGAQPSSWLHSMLTQCWVDAAVNALPSAPAHSPVTPQATSTSLNPSLTNEAPTPQSHAPALRVSERGCSPIAQQETPLLERREESETALMEEVRTLSVPDMSLTDAPLRWKTPTDLPPERRHSPPPPLDSAREADLPSPILAVAEPLRTTDVGTATVDAQEEEQTARMHRFGVAAVQEMKGVIPVDCLSEVVDCIMKKIQEQNVRAVALDDMQQQLRESIPSSREPAQRKPNTTTAPASPVVAASAREGALDENAKRELAIHLYSLREQVTQLQGQLDAREVALERELRQQRKKSSQTAARKITVEVVKAFEEEPVPYKKPPFRVAQRADGRIAAGGDYESDFENSHSRSPSSGSSSSSRQNTSRSSSIVTEISYDRHPTATPRGRPGFSLPSSISSTPSVHRRPARQSSSSSTLPASSSSSSLKWNGKPQRAALLSSSSLSQQVTQELNTTESRTSSSRTSSSRSISIDEQAAKDFWAKRAKIAQKVVAPSSSSGTVTTSSSS